MNVPSLSPCLLYQKMLDEHTALYEVREGFQGNSMFGQIAVVLENGDAPDPRRLWRVYVKGTMDLQNGFGATVVVPVVRFIEYNPESVSIPQQSSSESPALASVLPRPEGVRPFQTQPTSEARSEIQTVTNPISPLLTPQPVESPTNPEPHPLVNANAESSFRPSPIPSTWQLQANGDEVLTGLNGICATLALLSADDPNKVHVTLSNGTMKVFTVEKTQEAMRFAQDYCRAQ